MLIKNARVFVGHEFVSADVEFDRRIISVGTDSADAAESSDRTDIIDAADYYLVPGFIDIHTHGAVGEDFSDGSDAGLHKMAQHYAAHGVTSYLATTMTLNEDTLTGAMHTVRDYRRSGGAKCAGVHLEGPFLSSAKKGAQAEKCLHIPDAEMFFRLNDASGGQVRLVTVACEEPGGIEFIRGVSPVCAVSLGHSVADYDTAMTAFSAGADHVTHLYNGMPSLHHREPGIIGAALDSGAYVELICDHLHVHPTVIRATHRMYGDGLVLISDSLRCAGMPDGNYDLGGQQIAVRHGRATLRGTDTLAGSCITVLDAVRNLVADGIPLEDAVYAASTAAADSVRLHLGRIEPGYPADLLILGRDLSLKAVFIDGEKQENTVH